MQNYLRKKLKEHEGVRNLPYEDSVGVLTIGVGHNLERGVSDAVVALMLEEDIASATVDVKRAMPEFTQLDEVRQYVLTNMMFNLGYERFCGFKRMIAAVRHFDFVEAAHEMEDSEWFRQVGVRAEELRYQMQYGVFSSEGIT